MRRLCDAEGGLLLGARVTTPDALAAGILGAAGDPRPLLTPLAERILALEAGDAAGGPLSGLDPSGGLARALAATLQELRRAEVSAAVVRAAAADLGGAAGERLASVARALARWEERLAGLVALDAPGAVAGGAGPGGGAAEALMFAAGRGEEGQAEAAARFAAVLVERGFAPEEIAVVAASPERAAPQLARAFAAAGIPFATGRGAPLADAPPVRAILAALTAALKPERAEVEAVLGSPYLGVAKPPARLGYWLDRAGALPGRGSPEEALRRRAAGLGAPAAARERAQLLAAADALAALAAALRPLSAPGLPREHAARLRGFLVSLGVRRRAARAEPELARRDLAAISRLEERVDELVRALALLGQGGAALPAARWSSLLRAAIEGNSMLVGPEPAAGAAELWPLSEAPGLGARAAIVVGCQRGAFPASPPADPLVRDGERLAVNRAMGRLALRTRAAHR